MSTGGPRQRFVHWFSSRPDPNRSPRTANNTQDEFTVALDHPWLLSGPWAVRVLDCSLAEVRPDSNRRDLMLYSDVMVYEIVGHDRFPLLDWLPYNSNEYLRHQQSRHPFLRRVAREKLETIGFKIVDVTGRPPAFRTRAPTLVCLEFIPQDAALDDSSMECTFLSNQSRDVHPKNHPTDFTAQLPSIQRMDRGGQWEVGIVKLTLPTTTLAARQGDWWVKINFVGRKLYTTVKITERPDTIEGLIELLNSKIRQNIQTTYLTSKAKGLSGSFRQRCIVSKNDTFPLFRVGDRLTIYSVKQLVAAIRDGTGLGLRWGKVKKGQTHAWVLYLDTDNGETQLDVRGTFLQRLGFTKRDVSQWQGPLTTTGVPEYYVKATNRTFPNEKTLTMLGVEFSWNPATKKVTLETGWKDRKLQSVQVTLSKDLAELFHLTETAGLRAHPTDKTYTLTNNGKLEPNGSALYHVPLADEYEGWAKCCYGMLNVQSSEEVVYDFHHDETRARGYMTCSLLDPVMLGDRTTPLMDSIPLQTTFYESRGSVRPGGYVFEPQHVKYYPLSTSTFQSITFTVEDEQGRLLPLDPEGVTTVSMHFRKRP